VYQGEAEHFSVELEAIAAILRLRFSQTKIQTDPRSSVDRAAGPRPSLRCH
jgi:hypothetical protein